jgi:hypothetical protein
MMSTDAMVQAVQYAANSLLGFGFNINGDFRDSSRLRQLFDLNKTSRKTSSVYNAAVDLPDACRVSFLSQPKFEYGSGSGSSVDEVTESLAASAGVNASYGGFSGQFRGSYAVNTNSRNEYSYVFRHAHIEYGSLVLTAFGKELFADEFVRRINALPKRVNPSNLGQFANFFRAFGSHYIHQVRIGAVLETNVAVEKSSQVDSKKIEAYLAAEYKGVFLSGKAELDVKKDGKYASYRSSRRLFLRGLGGDIEAIIRFAEASFENPSPASVEAYTAWVASTKDLPATLDFSLRPVWELMEDREDVARQAYRMMNEKMRARASLESINQLATISLESGSVRSAAVDEAGVQQDTYGDLTSMGFTLKIYNRTKEFTAGPIYEEDFRIKDIPDSSPFKLFQKLDQAIRQHTDHFKPEFLVALASHSWPAPNIYSPASLITVEGEEHQLQETLTLCGAGEGLAQWNEGSPTGKEQWLGYLLLGAAGSTKQGVDKFSRQGNSAFTGRLTMDLDLERDEMDGSFQIVK